MRFSYCPLYWQLPETSFTDVIYKKSQAFGTTINPDVSAQRKALPLSIFLLMSFKMCYSSLLPLERSHFHGNCFCRSYTFIAFPTCYRSGLNKLGTVENFQLWYYLDGNLSPVTERKYFGLGIKLNSFLLVPIASTKKNSADFAGWLSRQFFTTI